MRAAMVCFFALSAALAAETLQVKIIGRQDNATEYTYTLPGYSFINVTCGTYSCTGSGYSFDSRMGTLQVKGATLSLLLPNGKVAVVNCESKFAERFAGPAGNRRSCRIPITDNIEAEFDGNKAKLIWPVSIDGNKKQSETYKILGVLDVTPQLQAQPAAAASPVGQRTAFVWFDEDPANPSAAPVFEVMVTPQAYDNMLTAIRKLRGANTNVNPAVRDVLESGYRPETMNYAAYAKLRGADVAEFYWKGEEILDSSPVMHFWMSKRAYQQAVALGAGTDLRSRPAYRK